MWEKLGGGERKVTDLCPMPGCGHPAMFHPAPLAQLEFLRSKSSAFVRPQASNSNEEAPSSFFSDCYVDSVYDCYYTGMNIDLRRQARLRKAVFARDVGCLVTSDKPVCGNVDAVHIVDPDKLHKFPKALHYHRSMAFSLRADFIPSYNGLEWYFKPDGTVVRLSGRSRRRLPEKLELPTDLNYNALLYREKRALKNNKGRCSYCWKQVGDWNLDDHRKFICDNPDDMAKRATSNDEGHTTPHTRRKKQNRKNAFKMKKFDLSFSSH